MKGNLLWTIDINNEKIIESEKLLNNLLRKIKNVLHVFQNTASNLIAVKENQQFYLVAFPNLDIQEHIDIDLTESEIQAKF